MPMSTCIVHYYNIDDHQLPCVLYLCGNSVYFKGQKSSHHKQVGGLLLVFKSTISEHSVPHFLFPASISENKTDIKQYFNVYVRGYS